MILVNTEKIRVATLTGTLVSSDCSFCRAAKNYMLPKPTGNLDKELQEA